MSPKSIALHVLKQHPELKELTPRQLRLVKRVVLDVVELSSRDLMSREETDAMFAKWIPDRGTPAAALRAYRYREDLTQRALSKKCGIPQPHIAAMESGARPIGLAIAKKLALALNADYRRFV